MDLYWRRASTAEKVEACARQLGVQHRLGQPTPPEPTSNQRRPYSFGKDGRLERGVRVWHKLHGNGRVAYAGVEQRGEVVEVAFDKGRTATFVAAMAGLDLLE